MSPGGLLSCRLRILPGHFESSPERFRGVVFGSWGRKCSTWNMGEPDTIGCSTWNIRLRPPEHPHLLAEKGRDTIPRNRCEGVGIGRFRGIVFRSESQVFHVEHQGESLAPLSAEDPAGSLRGQPRTIPRNRFWVPRAQLFHVEHGRAEQNGCSTWNIRLGPGASPLAG